MAAGQGLGEFGIALPAPVEIRILTRRLTGWQVKMEVVILRRPQMHHERQVLGEQQIQSLLNMPGRHLMGNQQLAAAPLQDAGSRCEHQIVDGKGRVQHQLRGVQRTPGGDHPQAGALAQAFQGPPVGGTQTRVGVQQSAVEIRDDHCHGAALSAPWPPPA